MWSGKLIRGSKVIGFNRLVSREIFSTSEKVWVWGKIVMIGWRYQIYLG